MARARWRLVFLAVASCVSARPPSVGEPPPALSDGAAEAAYDATLRRYTDESAVYDGFDTRLFAAATFQSRAFVEARVRRRGAFQAQTEAELQAELARELANLEEAHEVFLGVHLNDPRYDDFDRKGSIWRVVLVGPSGEVKPSSIERVGRANLDLRAIYPYMGSFWVGYRLRFPRRLESGALTVPPGTERVVLRIASALGRAELSLRPE